MRSGKTAPCPSPCKVCLTDAQTRHRATVSRRVSFAIISHSLNARDRRVAETRAATRDRIARAAAVAAVFSIHARVAAAFFSIANRRRIFTVSSSRCFAFAVVVAHRLIAL